ncbi:MAG: hypothetical protein ACRDSH_09870 [Pseudonocardiaceae bacterium]
MSDALSFAELYEQHIELLPARTVLSMFITGDDPSSSDGGIGGSGSGDVVSKLMDGVLSGAIPKS